MAKLVFKTLRGDTAHKAKPTSTVREKRIRTESGSKVVFTIDAASGTFDQDLTYVFGRNVARARRENKRVTGALDRVPAKD
jgi:hypothetical protein